MAKKLNVNDYVGKTFHYLTVLSEHSIVRTVSNALKINVNCICKCGKHTVKDLKSVKRGMTKSCGCMIKEVQTKIGNDKRVKFVSEGDVFGNLTVLYEIENVAPRKIRCVCGCGKEKTFNLSNLLKGTTTSCGCLISLYNKENGLKNRKVHLNPGDVYGKLTIIRECSGIKYTDKTREHRQYECQCECGNICVVQLRNLKINKTISCGCYARERQKEASIKHNLHKSPEYSSWISMKQRCYNPKSTPYDSYGGRGITVCDRWLESFDNFYEDMGPKPSPTHSIDRIDNYKLIDGYSKDNCRWATKSEQVQNRRIMDKQKTSNNKLNK
jgi:hypothetical protein